MGWIALLVTLLGGGCGSRYVPVERTSAAESPTSCPDERSMANRARENALTGGATWEAALGSAVLLHARCEHRVLADMELDAREEDKLMKQFDAARSQFYTARNLYSELLGYRDAKLRGEAESGLEELHEVFSAKLRAVRTMQAAFREVAVVVDSQRSGY